MLRVPFDIDRLPVGLRAVVRTALQGTKIGDALDQIEDFLFAGGDRQPDLLLALALLEVEFARSVMVDEVPRRTARALALIGEAVSLGADPRRVRGLQTLCRRLQALANQLEERARKSSRAAPEDLPQNELVELAYRLDDQNRRQSSLRAARLWLLASEREKSAADRHDYFVRAGLAFADANQWSEAIPILTYTVGTRPSKPGHESWMTEYAYDRLLTHAALNDLRDDYQRHWASAVKWAARNGEEYFPYPQPSQDAALKICLRWRLRDHCAYLLAIFDKHRKPRTISPTMRRVIESARKFVECDIQTGGEKRLASDRRKRKRP